MKQAFIATLLFCFFYSLQIVFQQVFVRSHIQPLHLNFLSYLLATIILTVYFLFFNKKNLVLLPDKKVSSFFLLALMGWILADFFAVYGLKFSSSTNYSILSRLMVFVVYLLSIFFLKEKINPNKTIASIISVIGGFLVIYNFKNTFKINIGDLFFLGTVFTQSISSITRQKVTKHMSSLQLTYLMFFYATIILGVITYFFNPITIMPPLVVIVFNSVVALVGFSLVNYAIQKGGAVFFTLVASLLPVFTAFFSFLILKQSPFITQIIGGLLIISSIFLFQRKRSLP